MSEQTSSEASAVALASGEEHALQRIVCWLNRWGDLEKHRAKVAAKEQKIASAWVAGYEQAISDTVPHLQKLAPGWLHTWRAEGWGFHREQWPTSATDDLGSSPKDLSSGGSDGTGKEPGQ